MTKTTPVKPNDSPVDFNYYFDIDVITEEMEIADDVSGK